MNNELYHHGIKKQRWGHRRFQNEDGTYTEAGKERYFGSRSEKKAAKKELKSAYKQLTRSILANEVATKAALSTFNKEDHDKAYNMVSNGQLYVKASFKKNFNDQSIDVYLGKQKQPTIKVKLDNGKKFTYDFMDKEAATRFNDFVDYYNNRLDAASKLEY